MAISPLPAHAQANQTSTSATARSDPRSAALAQAASTGAPVTVDALTTSDSVTQANPDGSLTMTTTVEPTRMQNSSGAWESIDPTLVRNPDGTLSTTATPNPLTLSGGGTGPAITASDSDGASFALSLPTSLPTPTLSGASATYTDVYPGVSLIVTAKPSGGFSEVFEVANQAAETQLSNLKFTDQLTGMTMAQASDGALTLTDSTSGQVMLAPPADEWDSATSATPATGVGDDFENVIGPDSNAQGPGTQAHTGNLPITASGNTLTLSGAASGLDTTSPTFPMYLDPTYTWSAPKASGGTENWNEAQQGCPTYTNWDDVSEPGVGNVTTNTSCPGAYRSYFAIKTTNLNSSDQIISATLMINEMYSALNDCNEGSETITIKTVDPIGASMDWDNQPGVVNTITSKSIESDGNSAGTMCSGGTVAGNFDMTSEMKTVAAGNTASQTKYPNLTIGMFGNETGSNTLERFNDNPSISTQYDIAPNVPTVVSTNPEPITATSTSGTLSRSECSTSASSPGNLGILDFKGNDVAQLTVKLTSPIAAAQMQAEFYFKDETTNTLIVDNYPPPGSGYVTTGGTSIYTTPTLTDGHVYGWGAWSTDQYLNSSGDSTECFFRADIAPPTNPALSSSSFAIAGQPGSTGSPTATSGTVVVTSTDPAPASGSASGLAGFYYNWDSPVPANGASYIAASNGSAAIPAPTGGFANWGTHVLYTQAVDHADNHSAMSQLAFFVPQNTAITDNSGNGGSLHASGVPDLIATTPDGNIVDYPANTDPQDSPTVLTTPAYSPSGDPWNDYLVTHRGNFTGSTNSSDDLWAFDTKNNQLYVGKNNGANAFENPQNWALIKKSDIETDNEEDINLTFPSTTPANEDYCLPTAETGCGDYNGTAWQNVSQILAINDIYGTDSADVSSGLAASTHFDLLTVENGNLWVYQANTNPVTGLPSLSYLVNPVELGAGNWDKVTLIAPGNIGGKPVIWARDDSNGDIYSYTITFGTDGYPNPLGAAGSQGTNGTVIATGFTSDAYPALSSPGPLNGASQSGLYAVDAANHLNYYAPNTSGGLNATPSYIGAIDSMTDRWTLTNTTCTTATSVTGNNNAATYGAPTCGKVTADGVTKPAFTFNGSNYAETTTGPVIDTAKSYTISAWADPTTANHYGQIASLCGTHHCALYLEENNSGEWEFAAENSDASTSTTTEINTTTQVALNTWTHVVGVYDATTGKLSLYINGALVGTTSSAWPTPWSADGNFTIAGSDYTSASGSFTGAIADVRAYQTALDQAQVTADYNGASTGLITQLD